MGRAFESHRSHHVFSGFQRFAGTFFYQVGQFGRAIAYERSFQNGLNRAKGNMIEAKYFGGVLRLMLMRRFINLIVFDTIQTEQRTKKTFMANFSCKSLFVSGK